MSRLTFSPLAVADVGGIWDYAAENGELNQADQYTDDIRDVCHDLAIGEKRGWAVDIRDGYPGKHPWRSNA